MNGREALEALERELGTEYKMLNRMGHSDVSAIGSVMKALSAALKAGPQDEGEPRGADELCEWGAPNAGTVIPPAQSGSTVYRCPDGYRVIADGFYDRLRAWEKWGREVAEPALEWLEKNADKGRCNTATRALEALPALPTDPPAGEP